MGLMLLSDELQDGQPIPEIHTRQGGNVSPPLRWAMLPRGAREFALIAEDRDAPGDEPEVLWVIYRIPNQTDRLPDGLGHAPRPRLLAGAAHGVNSTGRTGYDGPNPPEGAGPHHCHFRLYALDTHLELPPGADKQALLDAMDGHVLDQAEMVVTCQR